jgi:hypothetical protein
MKTVCLLLITSVLFGMGVPSIESDKNYTPTNGGATAIKETLDVGMLSALEARDIWKVVVVFILVAYGCREANK